MNQVFRIIWNRTLGRFVIASEMARSSGKSTVSRGIAGGVILSGVLAMGLGGSDDALARKFANDGATCNSSGGSTEVGRLTTGATNSDPVDGSGTYSTVAGCNADGNNQLAATAYGTFSEVRGAGGLAVGFNSQATKWATALGLETRATQTAATALGFGSQATALNAIAIGAAGGDGTTPLSVANSTIASGSHSIAIGADNVRGAQAKGKSSIALGGQALAAGAGDIAIGQEATVFGRDDGISAVTIGFKSNAMGAAATALGNSTNASADFSLALGNFAASSARNSAAVGNSASASGVGASAFGNFSSAQGPNATALGGGGEPGSFQGAQALAGGATAIGGNAVRGASADGVNSIAVGGEATSSGVDAIAIGTGSIASGNQSISIGLRNDVSGTGSGAIGDPTTITGAGSYSLGNDNTIAADNAGTFGNDNVLGADADGSRIIGNANGTSTTPISAADAFIIGNNADVTVDGGVALGSESVADTAGGVAGYDPLTGAASTDITSTWLSTNSAISVGDADNDVTRQITGVAAGTSDTDAVNIAQLKASETHYYSVNDNGVQGGNYANDGATGINAIASGVDASATADGAIAMGSGAEASALRDVMIGDGAGDNAGTGGRDNIAIGGFAGQGRGDSGSFNVATGFMAGQNVTGNNNAAYGRSAGQNVEGSNNLALGTGAGRGTDPSLRLEADRTVSIGNGALASADDAIAIGSGAQANGLQAISIGTGNQVDGDNSGAIGDPTTITGDGSYSLGNDNTIAADNAGTFGNDNVLGADADGSRVIGNGNGTSTTPISAADAFIIGNNADVTVDGGVALGSESAADTAGGVAGYDPVTGGASTDTTSTWLSTRSTISVGDADNDVTRQITGVAAGTSDTDAVNVAQLKGVEDLATSSLTFAGDGGTNVERQLGETLNITGGATGALTDGNIGVVGDGTDTLALQLAEDIDLGANGSVTAGDSLLDTNGLTVDDGAGNVASTTATGTTVTDGTTTTAMTAGGLTSGNINLDGTSDEITGLSNTTLTDPGFATEGRAATEEQLDLVNQTAKTGWNLTAEGADGTNVAPGDTVDLSNSDGNLVIAKNATDGAQEDVTFELADDVTVDSVTAGDSLLDTNGLTVDEGAGNVATTTATGTTVTDGTTITAMTAGGLTSGNINLDGTSDEITGLSNTTLTDPGFATEGRAATEEQLDLASQNLTDQGLNFAGDSGTDVHRDLGQTLNLNGGADASGNTNISTVANGTDGLAIVMTDQPTFGDVTVNTGGGGTINELSNLTFDPDSFTSGQAATEDQLAAVSDVANTGWNLTAEGADGTNVAPGDTVDLSNTDGNLVIAKNATDGAEEDVTFDLADDITVDIVTAGDSLLDTNGLTVDDGAGNVASTTATGTMVTDGTTTTAMMAGGLTSGNINLDGTSNEITGLSNTTLTDPGFATEGRAATEEQLDLVNQTANTGWNLTAEGADGTNVAPGDTVDLSNTDGNLVIAKNATDGAQEDVTFDLADDITVDSVTAGDSLLDTNGLTVDDGAGNVATTTATGTTVTDGTTTTAMTAGGLTSGNINLDGTSDEITGLSNTTLTDPGFATEGRAATEEQLDLVNQTANTGWNLTAEGADGTNVAPGDTVDLSNSDGNLVIAKNATDGAEEDVIFDLADDITVDSVTAGDSLLDTNGLTVDDGAGNVASTTATGTTVTDGTTTTAMTAGGVTSGNINLDGTSDEITGLSNTTLTDPGFATEGRAATEEQLDLVNQTANTGWNLTAEGADGTNVAPGDTVDLSNTDGNLVIAKNATDGAEEGVTFDLADDVTIGNSLTINNGPTLNDNGIDMGGDRITNVGGPTNGGDAVNLDYFNENKAHYYSVNDGGTQGGNYANDGATGINAIASGVDASATADGAIAMGSGAEASAFRDVMIGDGAGANAGTGGRDNIAIGGSAGQ
ncbi:ESPR-type extended signal peptide-containing protein [Halomonas huangheensis]|uniref:ESPR-type extended signal peptide-containing protein n=3 Tax=Halomonas huangheensis TaxID=1178482 RepID=UPI0007030A69|nr:ESPR-type extended signal peptide-containing protein [Halomonas huangheensis]ALM52468.1 hypothetical protein AR456_09375 [Halomonas huangheensis]